jgi:hypothetical protein
MKRKQNGRIWIWEKIKNDGVTFLFLTKGKIVNKLHCILLTTQHLS